MRVPDPSRVLDKNCAPIRGFAKGWFPKGWFWRMFPRNENRNEGTFAKTTLLETALLSPSDLFGGFQKGGFQKGGFGGCSPGTKTGTRVRSPKPPFTKPPFYLPVTHGSRTLIQYWGWGLEEGPSRLLKHFQTPVLY